MLEITDLVADLSKEQRVQTTSMIRPSVWTAVRRYSEAHDLSLSAAVEELLCGGMVGGHAADLICHVSRTPYTGSPGAARATLLSLARDLREADEPLVFGSLIEHFEGLAASISKAGLFSAWCLGEAKNIIGHHLMHSQIDEEGARLADAAELIANGSQPVSDDESERDSDNDQDK